MKQNDEMRRGSYRDREMRSRRRRERELRKTKMILINAAIALGVILIVFVVAIIKLNGKNTIRKFVLDEENNIYQLIAKNTYCKTIDIPVDNLYDTIQILGKVVKAENESAFK